MLNKTLRGQDVTRHKKPEKRVNEELETKNTTNKYLTVNSSARKIGHN